MAVAANAEGRREIVGLHIGPSEAETFWAAFLKSLVKRGLHSVKLVISDSHEGLKAAIARMLRATWQRCRVHFARNALAHVPRGQQAMAAAALRHAFLQAGEAAAHQTWRQVSDGFRPRWPKLADLMDASEHDVLAYMGFPAQHRSKLHSVNPLERAILPQFVTKLPGIRAVSSCTLIFSTADVSEAFGAVAPARQPPRRAPRLPALHVSAPVAIRGHRRQLLPVKHTHDHAYRLCHTGKIADRRPL